MGEQRKKRERDLTMAARNCRSRRSSTGLALQPTSAHSELVSASLSPSSFRYLDATTWDTKCGHNLKHTHIRSWGSFPIMIIVFMAQDFQGAYTEPAGNSSVVTIMKCLHVLHTSTRTYSLWNFNHINRCTCFFRKLCILLLLLEVNVQ